ncbi:universal stress protein [Streptomyces sp. NPDC093261]|uniref:universal stress protein n=1 Tax=Streptomyces sp. NPDC093261 TaxID=3366037 RepID=UPI0037F64F7A
MPSPRGGLGDRRGGSARSAAAARVYHQERASTLIDALLQDPAADHPDVRMKRTTVEGPVHKVLLHRSAAADLVVIGAARGHDPHGLRLGRVGHTLLHQAQRPVAVVPELP